MEAGPGSKSKYGRKRTPVRFFDLGIEIKVETDIEANMIYVISMDDDAEEKMRVRGLCLPDVLKDPQLREEIFGRKCAVLKI